ncbi:PAS domain-containing protein [Sphingomonas sp. AAP5]|uniref:two-component system sensor histidine kinase NtrB n=1 Tax=unclassified Sphingomonas TaxID=196159 RepID=UPI001057026A|nr:MULTISPECIES: ATP-binding protein [unclassified Sphingomonas]MDY7525884.1 ATP-binding protein [Sphingomonas sp. 10B4]MEB0283371.1 ATP-binding protein [Sphingomonas sp. 10B4]QBM75387.1 PAS domain-containing protein [Sphingomonas sp. AAP5]
MVQPRRRVKAIGGPDFADLFAALPVAVLVVDDTGCIVFANAECETLLNLSERAMLGHPLVSVMTPPSQPNARDNHGLAAFDTEIALKRGGKIRVDYIETRVADHPGWHTITLHHAATSRRMGHSADRAAAARAAIGAAAMLAHEIKNPLSGIRGAAQLLSKGKGAEELTTLITTEVDRIAALIDRMQDFTDTRPLKLAPENIYPLLGHARRVALAGFARHVTIEERFDPSLPTVQLDRDAILQVVLNLLKNASEATSEQADARITLATAYRHGMAVAPAPGKPRQRLPIEICVSDNGPGPPADIAEHLFDPFISGKPEGQGLGLALVDKLVRDMGGIIQFAREGAPPMTVFRILLPRGDA